MREFNRPFRAPARLVTLQRPGFELAMMLRDAVEGPGLRPESFWVAWPLYVGSSSANVI